MVAGSKERSSAAETPVRLMCARSASRLPAPRAGPTMSMAQAAAADRLALAQQSPTATGPVRPARAFSPQPRPVHRPVVIPARGFAKTPVAQAARRDQFSVEFLVVPAASSASATPTVVRRPAPAPPARMEMPSARPTTVLMALAAIRAVAGRGRPALVELANVP